MVFLAKTKETIGPYSKSDGEITESTLYMKDSLNQVLIC